jgi:enoyl-CoA hydratase
MNYGDFGSLIVEMHDQVARIQLKPILEAMASQPPGDVHQELPTLLTRLREDHSVRVIVITGAHDGEFLTPPPMKFYKGVTRPARRDPVATWKVMQGVIRMHGVMAEIEKPIVARVNGDAIGLGQSIMFSCDLIAAREDAVISEGHLAQGTVSSRATSETFGPPFGIVPGDGAGATLPLFMSPVKAKEFLMLSGEWTAARLAEMGCINYSIPLSMLDQVVDDLVTRLLSKSAYALAWTKRVANRHLVQQLNLTLDAGLAYEMLTMHQLPAEGDGNMDRLG